MKNSILFLSILFLFSSCKNSSTEQTTDQLGELHIQFNGSQEAMPYFTKGLKLLHNFEYDDACAEFKNAQEHDPTFVMAHWGEAMTYNHPLWRQQDYEKGQAALGKLAETPEERAALAKTDLEKDFLQCMEIMYGPEGNKKERDSMYSKQLESMYKKYKGNEEVAAFYALSLLGAVKVGRDVAAYEKGADVAKNILKMNPNHPGALHYLIHSYDDPDHAHMALPAAFSYSKVAADATHALHMPSHIFVSVGMWDEVIKSNIASWNASYELAQQDTASKSFGSYHALHWWMYGELQKGQFGNAERLMKDMKKYADGKPSERARNYLIGMKANYLVETGQWDNNPIANYTCDIEQLGLVSVAQYHWMEGMKAFKKKDAKTLQQAIKTLDEKRLEAGEKVSLDGIPMCSAAGSKRNMTNQLDIDQASILLMQLNGMLAELNGNDNSAETSYQQAAEKQYNLSMSFGPPVIPMPSYELYGEWLMKNGQPELAAGQFAKSLEKGPKRRRALMGQLEAAKALKNEKQVAEIEAVLAEVLAAADEKQS